MITDSTDATEGPATVSKLTRSEAIFQGSLDGLLILLYMTAFMIFVSELQDRPLQFWMWALQGVAFAIIFAGLRISMILRGSTQLNFRAKLLRNRCLLFIMSGAVVAVAAGAELMLGRTVSGSMLGLAFAGGLTAFVGLVGLWRLRRAEFKPRA